MGCLVYFCWLFNPEFCLKLMREFVHVCLRTKERWSWVSRARVLFQNNAGYEKLITKLLGCCWPTGGSIVLEAVETLLLI